MIQIYGSSVLNILLYAAKTWQTDKLPATKLPTGIQSVLLPKEDSDNGIDTRY